MMFKQEPKELLELYDETGLIYLSCRLGESSNGKKYFIPSMDWTNATESYKFKPNQLNKFKIDFDDSEDTKSSGAFLSNLWDYNNIGLQIPTGRQLKDKSYFICIDLDNKEDEEAKNGLSYFNDLCLTNNYVIDTAFETTGNNGLHLLYKVDEAQMKNIKSGGLKAIIDGQKYNIDILGLGRCMISAPSSYYSEKENKIKSYEWSKLPTLENIKKMPRFIYNMIINASFSKKKVLAAPIKTIKSKIDESIIDNINGIAKEVLDLENPHFTEYDRDLDQYIKLLYILDKTRFDDYDDWIRIGLIIKSLGLSFTVYLELSKQSTKFGGYNEVFKKWNSFKINKPGLHYLHYMAKLDNIDEYNKIVISDYKTVDELDLSNVKKLLTIESNYLLNLDYKLVIPNIKDKSKIENLNEDLIKTVHRWQTDETIKSLNIKSPYDTGKTTLLTSIIEKYKPKRILWISYRKTLTDNLLSVFNNYNFGDYQKQQFDNDRLICQVESLKHLTAANLLDDEIDVPSYDLIIMDEIESILNHFLNTKTMKGNSRELFDFMSDIIRASKKVISLDGDLGSRALKYLDSFGESFNVHNKIIKNIKNYILTNNEIKFKEAIIEDLSNNKKIVLCSMSCSFITDIKAVLKEMYPNKNLLFYTGLTDDNKKKEELKNIDQVWSKADLIAYSPTIEAGVSFDKDNYFDKIYGLINDGSCPARAFRQMLARVRKIKDNNVILLNRTNKKLYDVFYKSNYFNYDEIKEMVMTLEKVNTKLIKDENGQYKRVKQLEQYDINHIYNNVEYLNSKHYFLYQFQEQIIKSGHTLTDNSEIKRIKEKNDKKDNSLILENDISNDEYIKLLQKQKNGLATEEDKAEIKKHCLKKMYGVDRLDDLILKIKPETIENYLYLIDESNKHYNYNDNINKERLERLNVVNQLIQDLGFINHYDKKMINDDDFDNKLKYIEEHNVIYSDLKRTKILFGLSKIPTKIKDNKTIMSKELKDRRQKLGFLNTLIHSYGLSIVSKQTDRKPGAKNKSSVYFLRIDEGLDEIIDYKIKKGFQLKDTREIRKDYEKTEFFKHLIDDIPIKKEINKTIKKEYNILELDNGIQSILNEI